VVTDEEIALMSPQQRRDLIRRLSLASWNVRTFQHRSVGRREVEIIILVFSAVNTAQDHGQSADRRENR
jgi:hypothetical protein